MASVTLAESAKLCQNELVAGLIENVITVNRFFEILPFDEIEGNALQYSRENALGAVQRTTVDTSITTGKNPATFTQVTSGLTTILGDAEVNGLIQATRSNPNDQAGIQVASKSKSVGRDYQDQLINGDGTSNAFTGLLSLCDAGQKVNFAGAYDLDKMDELIDLVLDKDGVVDYIMMPSRTIRSHNKKLRALGGASIGETVQLPSGKTIPSYREIPIFRNDWLPVNQTSGSLSNCTSIIVGTLDDGTRQHGIAGLNARGMAGIQVEYVGLGQDKDNQIWRVKWYCGLALFSLKGLALGYGVTD